MPGAYPRVEHQEILDCNINNEIFLGQHTGIQDNDIQDNDTKHTDAQHNYK